MPHIAEQEAKAAVEVAINEISSHGKLLIRLGQLVWKKITGRSPYSTEDKKKYDKLVSHYTICTEQANIPEQWTLDDDNRPQYHAGLSASMKALNKEIENIAKTHGQFNGQVIVMIQTISNFFKSIETRKGFIQAIGAKVLGAGEYRDDGFEQMFFNELAIWASGTLLRSTPEEASTAEEIKKRLDYCYAVYTHVLVDRKDADKPNAFNQLAVVIEQLKGIYEDILKCSQARTFNQTMTGISEDISQMAGQTFTICHFISEYDHPKPFAVTEYINPQLKSAEIDRYLKSLMAGWMIQTFKIAGVENNNFQNKNPVDLKMIPEYLLGNLSDDFLRAKIPTSGLPQFARSSPDTAKVHLEKIAKMHQAILNLYHVRQSLIVAAQVVTAYGEVWLYGDDEGKLVLNALLAVIQDVCKNHINAVKTFWMDFYGEDPITPNPGSYLDHVKQHPQEKTKSYADYIEEGQNAYNSMMITGVQIQQKIRSVLEAAQNFTKDKESAKQKKQDLIGRLYEYMERMPGISPAQLSAIKCLLEQVKQPIPSTQATNPASTPDQTQAQAATPAPIPVQTQAQAATPNPTPAQPKTQVQAPTVAKKPGAHAAPTPAQTQTTNPPATPAQPQTNSQVQPDIKPKPVILKSADSSIYSRAKELLEYPLEPDDTLMTDHELMSPPTEFYSDIQRDIYRSFLQPFNKPVNAWLGWSAFRIYGMSIDEMKRIRHGYTVINTIMKMIYTPPDRPLRAEMTSAKKTEMDLIDQYLRKALHEIDHSLNLRSKNIVLSDTQSQLFKVTQVADNFEIRVDDTFLEYASGSYADQLKALSDELDATKLTLSQRDAQLIAKDVAIGTERSEKLRIEARKNQLEQDGEKKDEEIAKEKELKLQLEKTFLAKELTAKSEADILKTKLEDLEKEGLEQKTLIDLLRTDIEARESVLQAENEKIRSELEANLAGKEIMIQGLMKKIEEQSSRQNPQEIKSKAAAEPKAPPTPPINLGRGIGREDTIKKEKKPSTVGGMFNAFRKDSKDSTDKGSKDGAAPASGCP